jgi:leader peptidase (prepilin peptidase)/N-methyltransferase
LFPEWTWIIGLVIGAAIGSFLNVVIYRMPRGISLGKPTYSFCPKCNHRLYMSDMIPLLTWLMRKGRCIYCDAKVPSRYFFVELTNGLIWAGIWWQYLIANQDPAKAITYSLAAAALVAIIWIDLELYTIPDQINAALAFFGIGYNIYLYIDKWPQATTWGMPSALAGWLVGVGVLWGIAFLGRIIFGRMAMGEGDIKMARGIGALLFPLLASISFGLAIVIGAVVGSIHAYISARKRRTSSAVVDGPIELEGIFVRRVDGKIEFRVTDTTNEPLIPRKTTQTFSFFEKVEYYGGEKQISEQSFWSDVTGEMPMLLHVRRDGEGYSIEAIGKNQNALFSLLKSGLGYVLGIDILGLFYVPLYKWWFKEDPFEPPADLESFDAGASMIPFGPYLAIGAIIATIFAPQLVQGLENYLNWAGIREISWEQGLWRACLNILG